MKNRLIEKLAALKADKKKALITYLTAGDPSLAETPGLVVEAARAGADIVELGVPWSDPSADGPVIQRAMERALASGGAGKQTLARVLGCVAEIRKTSEVPIVLFGYFNPLMQRGLGRVVAEAREAGVDGFLVVDLPPEESEELDGLLQAQSLCRVPLLAPTSSPERARTIVARGSGFAYYVAVTGVTGAGHLDVADVRERVQQLRPSIGKLPLAVGFGVKDPQSARAIAEIADAVVVGSALVQAIEKATSEETRKRAVHDMVSSLRAAI